jgi:hypothetical protein
MENIGNAFGLQHWPLMPHIVAEPQASLQLHFQQYYKSYD